MKKFIATVMMMAMMALMLMPLAASAQTSRRYNRNRAYTSQNYEKPNVYDKHRNVINIGAGAGIGALIGAIAGGGKGAAIGAIIGGGGAAAYSYGINPKDKNNRRRY